MDWIRILISHCATLFRQNLFIERHRIADDDADGVRADPDPRFAPHFELLLARKPISRIAAVQSALRNEHLLVGDIHCGRRGAPLRVQQRPPSASEPRYRGVLRCVSQQRFARPVFVREGLAGDSHWLTIRIVCIGEVAITSARVAIAAPKNRSSRYPLFHVERTSFKVAEICTVDIGAERKQNQFACSPRVQRTLDFWF
jgi:hypothetical protein